MAAMATISSMAARGETRLDFGNGDVLRLLGVTDTAGLADQIDIV